MKIELNDLDPIERFSYKVVAQGGRDASGNRDDFGEPEAFKSFVREEGIYYLHNHVRKVKTLKIGGLSGIIGRPDKPFRNDESEHLKELKKLLLAQPDFILLHEGPNNVNPELPGNHKIRAVLERSKRNVVCCGHNYWDRPLIEMENGTQILNVDSRCIILKIER